jgi:hypothetical protein
MFLKRNNSSGKNSPSFYGIQKLFTVVHKESAISPYPEPD